MRCTLIEIDTSFCAIIVVGTHRGDYEVLRTKPLRWFEPKEKRFSAGGKIYEYELA